MGFSNLISEIIKASSSNYTKGRAGYKICKFTPHHMAGKLTGEQCAKFLQNPNRRASANYCIGYDGEIVGCVDENDRAWTSANKANDCQAITVEVSNSKNGDGWPISDKAWNSLVELAIDVCTRYNFRLSYDGTPKGSLTTHNMFVNTSCPGPYLLGRMEELVEIVNARLDNREPEPKPETNSQEGYLVKVTTSVLNIRKEPTINSSITGQIKDKGTYTIVAESDGKGASKWGKLKSGIGWISLDYVSKITSNEVPTNTIPATIKKGDKAVFIGSTDYNGKTMASWTKGSVFDVIEIFGDRAVIGKGTAVTAAVKISDLAKM